MATSEPATGIAEVVPDHVPEALVHAYDLFEDPGMKSCPFSTIEKLREYGRIFWNPTNRMFGGSWVLTKAEDLRYVLTNPHLFSNKGETGFLKAAGESEEFELIPLELDPPRHTEFRKLMNHLLAPPAVARLTTGVEAKVTELLDQIIDRGECDFMGEFAIPFPVSIFMIMMGLPEEDFDKLLALEDGLLHTSDPAIIQKSSAELGVYLQALADKRRAEPVDDITSEIVAAEIDGRPLTDMEVRGIMFLLFLAGLDTVGSSMGFIFHYLAENPDRQQELRENPDRIPHAIEEMLRRHSIIVSHRQCTQDLELAGVQMKKGDWIAIHMSMGSLDPSEFSNPHEVDFDRKNVRHFAFNFGPHFCMGSHLARRELKIALEQWLARVSQWRLKPDAENVTHGGHTFGFNSLHLEWDVA